MIYREYVLYTPPPSNTDKLQFLDELHEPTVVHTDVNAYLEQLDNLDYDSVESILDDARVGSYGCSAC